MIPWSSSHFVPGSHFNDYQESFQNQSLSLLENQAFIELTAEPVKNLITVPDRGGAEADKDNNVEMKLFNFKLDSF